MRLTRLRRNRMKLSDVGSEIEFSHGDHKLVIMAIKAPNGMCRIWQSSEPGTYIRRMGMTNTDAHCMAIRAFMEEHRND